MAVKRDTHVVLACQKGRQLAAQLGFSENDQVIIVIAISEVASNMLHHAQHGEIILSPIQRGRQPGLLVVARDDGPGIPDIQAALQDGYSTGRGLGLGLGGARRLMDEFEIVSQLGQGTTITMRKWKK